MAVTKIPSSAQHPLQKKKTMKPSRYHPICSFTTPHRYNFSPHQRHGSNKKPHFLVSDQNVTPLHRTWCRYPAPTILQSNEPSNIINEVGIVETTESAPTTLQSNEPSNIINGFGVVETTDSARHPTQQFYQNISEERQQHKNNSISNHLPIKINIVINLPRSALKEPNYLTSQNLISPVPTTTTRNGTYKTNRS
jgi:hypothetical protein